MKRFLTFLIILPILAGCSLPQAKTSEIERGRYVVEIMGCNDCHTPGYMGRGTYVEESDWLTGDTLGYHGTWGTSYPTNLRLMLNAMTEEEWLLLAKRMRKDSPMAWVMLPKLTDEDLTAVYRFVQYLGPKGVPAPQRLAAGVVPSTEYINFPNPH